ncbi:MAG: hypothetical protein AAGK32_01780, partial [Actinomycetota bacterium]
MSANGSSAAGVNGKEPDPSPGRPGIADLGSFRGRAGAASAPVLPPAWRPGTDGTPPATEPASTGLRTVTPTEPPAVAPASPGRGAAPDMTKRTLDRSAGTAAASSRDGGA